ncbi:hypothetical protein SAMN06298216_0216 [Spirosomataceae bacterium TFI 002]|nr:hypothetical protein SAMN06298216_0216 [Spirosomataceae bacterium TFI 002]
MTEKSISKTIQQFTTSVIENTIDISEAERNINEIHAHFQQLTGITGFDFSIENLAAVPTAKGKALGLNYAAQCLLDFKRTVKFLRAIVAAILRCQKEQPGKTINIFYAGCGPYAPFVTLVAPLFNPDEIQFTLLEINKNSVDSAKKLIGALNLTKHVKEVFIADAVTFKVPSPKAFHILISETLDAMLFRECYVPILFNLLPQFNENVILIPENVIINLSFLPLTEGDAELGLGSVLDVRESIMENSNLDEIPTMLPEKVIDLKSHNLNQYDRILLDTKVHVQGEIWLTRNESSLTIPLQLTLEQPFTKKTIAFTYEMEPQIELKCRFE